MEHWRNIMTNKEQFLQNNVGFHKEDLSIKRRLELSNMIRRLGVDNEWMFAALSLHTLEEWEKFGFGLMKNADFQEEVKYYLEDINEISEEEFEKEIKKTQILVNEEDFRARWNAVKKQGKVFGYSEGMEKAREAGTSVKYIGYSDNCENEELIDQWIEQYDELPMELWTTFFLSTATVMQIYW